MKLDVKVWCLTGSSIPIGEYCPIGQMSPAELSDPGSATRNVKHTRGFLDKSKTLSLVMTLNTSGKPRFPVTLVWGVVKGKQFKHHWAPIYWTLCNRASSLDYWITYLHQFQNVKSVTGTGQWHRSFPADSSDIASLAITPAFCAPSSGTPHSLDLTPTSLAAASQSLQLAWLPPLE